MWVKKSMRISTSTFYTWLCQTVSYKRICRERLGKIATLGCQIAALIYKYVFFKIRDFVCTASCCETRRLHLRVFPWNFFFFLNYFQSSEEIKIRLFFYNEIFIIVRLYIFVNFKFHAYVWSGQGQFFFSHFISLSWVFPQCGKMRYLCFLGSQFSRQRYGGKSANLIGLSTKILSW